jgi:hypothetical protein
MADPVGGGQGYDVASFAGKVQAAQLNLVQEHLWSEQEPRLGITITIPTMLEFKGRILPVRH